MARRGVIGLVAGLAAVLGSCGLLGGPAEVRYRVTVEVIDNGIVRSGSSVWSWQLNEADLPLATAYDGKLRGEAVAVDMSGGRTLFAILRGADGQSGMAELLPERLFGDIGRASRGEETQFSPDRVADLRDIASREGEAATLDCAAHPGWCPMLVSFADIDNPASVKQVQPGNLAATFGPGVRLKAITVEITDDPVTSGIEKRLGWIRGHRGSLDFTGRLHPNAPEKDVTSSAFQQGIEQ